MKKICELIKDAPIDTVDRQYYPLLKESTHYLIKENKRKLIVTHTKTHSNGMVEFIFPPNFVSFTANNKCYTRAALKEYINIMVDINEYSTIEFL